MPSRKMKKNIESLQKGSKGHRKIPCGAGFEQSNPLLVTTFSTQKLNIGTIKTNRSAQLNFRLYAPVFAA